MLEVWLSVKEDAKTKKRNKDKYMRHAITVQRFNLISDFLLDIKFLNGTKNSSSVAVNSVGFSNQFKTKKNKTLYIRGI